MNDTVLGKEELSPVAAHQEGDALAGSVLYLIILGAIS